MAEQLESSLVPVRDSRDAPHSNRGSARAKNGFRCATEGLVGADDHAKLERGGPRCLFPAAYKEILSNEEEERRDSEGSHAIMRFVGDSNWMETSHSWESS